MFHYDSTACNDDCNGKCNEKCNVADPTLLRSYSLHERSTRRSIAPEPWLYRCSVGAATLQQRTRNGLQRPATTVYARFSEQIA